MVAAVWAIFVLGPTSAGWADGHGGRWRYEPPTTAPVVDPFRPPPQPWLAGNRGIEYAPRPGSTVRAIGPGIVTFAGPVAGRKIVVVRHPDGLRSSYVGLAALRARAGDRVEGGEQVGVAAARLHLGVRRGQAYLDPASLWGKLVGRGRVVLIPDRRSSGDESPTLGRRSSRRYTQQPAHQRVSRIHQLVRTPSNGRCQASWWCQGSGYHLNRWRGAIRVGSRRHHEAVARSPSPLRSPDPALEPQDEAVHLRRAQRHLHHRSRADAQAPRDRLHRGS